MSEMSEWMPKDNEFVMVGERGPLRAIPQGPWSARCALFEDGTDAYVGEVPTAWLTPAPEPEPDEPTAPGALVRFGESLAVQRGQFSLYDKPWLILTGPLQGSVRKWSELTAYPIAVVLADPAEVEQLRTDLKASEAQADELQRRIDAAQEWAADYPGLRRILRGES